MHARQLLTSFKFYKMYRFLKNTKLGDNDGINDDKNVSKVNFSHALKITISILIYY